jgi:glutamate-1-semialdehyde 2,1-aminomutase
MTETKGTTSNDHRDGGRSFLRSDEFFRRASNTIPLASQTFSKSALQFVQGAAPLFLDRGKGARVWDVDGNEYLDYVGGLLPVILGYCDEDVDTAIRAQLEKGITVSLPTALEFGLAERLVDLIPCAEMVRYGKNGSDATSAAIRLARAYTGRERIACCGYHGWHDWYIGSTTRNLGVPAAVSDLTSVFTYNDADSLEQLLQEKPDDYAAVILEPMTFVAPEPDFLPRLRALTEQYGVVLIFDEIITGFRMHMGGAQSHFGVTPDLACFGKSMGNGMPISAVVGRQEIMKGMEDIFFSGTFGGEALSLAAALATIDKLERENALPRIHAMGADLSDRLARIFHAHEVSDYLATIGESWWLGLSVKGDGKRVDDLLMTSLLRQELAAQGILQCGSFNLSLAHTADGILDETLERWELAVGRLSDHLLSNDPIARLRGKPIEPVFKVRN